MPDTYTASGWACTDCTILFANGENPPEATDAEINAWKNEIARNTAGYDVTLGMPREQHECLDDNGHTAGDNDGECECETESFSWSPCDVCAGNLGGERHAVSFFEREKESELEAE